MRIDYVTILSGMVKVDVTYRLGQMKDAGWDDVSSGGCHQATEPGMKNVLCGGTSLRPLLKGSLSGICGRALRCTSDVGLECMC